jgi:hypothetical protein
MLCNRRFRRFGVVKVNSILKGIFLLVFCLGFFGKLSAHDDCMEEDSPLLCDLSVVAEIDKRINFELPVIFNYQMQGGYLTMPSARMAKSGVIGFGFSYLPPYRVYSLLFQLFDRVEVTGNYWIYHGVTEGNFGHLGFGDDAERAGNVKFSILRKNDGIPELPEIVVGLNDFIGTRRFHSVYMAATQTFNNLNLELTLGWGHGRIHGFFGGGAWSPFCKQKHFLKNLSFIFEYDANNYKKHTCEHANGREVKVRWNAGMQLTLFNFLHLSVSTLRGTDVAASASFTYNLGASKGLLPKTQDPTFYTSPIDTQAISELRSQGEFGQELAYAFQEQGFDLYTAVLEPRDCGKNHLWLKVINVRYREEEVVRSRIESVLSCLMPENIESVSVVVEAEGVPVHEYRFRTADLTRFHEKQLGEWEFRVIAPLREASRKPGEYDSATLYKRKKAIWLFTFLPLFQPYFGSSTGKFKYDVGFQAGPEGYLFDEIYYSLSMSYIINSSSYSQNSCDFLNPSQIINVRSDTIRYHKSNTFHLDELFIQKSWNLGQGWFARAAVGYFETAYAGIALEALYYPVRSSWAIGFEGASVLKRKYTGMGLTRKIRKLQGFCPTYVHYVGLQYFLDVYYQFKPLELDFKFTLGQFLAKDKGIRMEMARNFPSGLKVGIWYAFTNANDVVNGKRYFDKGFYITMPLDLFLNKSSRTRIGYSMAAWLRDIDGKASTGRELYETIYYERYNERENFY